MVMIVFHHFAIHGGFDWKMSDITATHFWYNFILMGGKIGVNIFVLISGYFLITSRTTELKLKRILKLWGQIIFYSIGIVVVYSLNRVYDVGMKMAIKALFPITFSSWWFVSAYFVLYLIHPFLNVFL